MTGILILKDFSTAVSPYLLKERRWKVSKKEFAKTIHLQDRHSSLFVNECERFGMTWGVDLTALYLREGKVSYKKKIKKYLIKKKAISKTIEDVKEEVAKDQGYDNWSDLETDYSVYNNYSYEYIIKYISERYALSHTQELIETLEDVKGYLGNDKRKLIEELLTKYKKP